MHKSLPGCKVQVSTGSDHSCVHIPMHERMHLQMHVHGRCPHDYRHAPHGVRSSQGTGCN
ncbi:hypothetical protein EAO77_08920 [Streptomyces sp. t39]|nr:hypothetical protein EAO77_08920 [Streptomyces sp. t39]